jgi:membrane peptidoglycan carboxypeptidase
VLLMRRLYLLLTAFLASCSTTAGAIGGGAILSGAVVLQQMLADGKITHEQYDALSKILAEAGTGNWSAAIATSAPLLAGLAYQQVTHKKTTKSLRKQIAASGPTP